MIILNGAKFAETEQEFINSLFEHNGTCSGYAKRYKHKIKLYDHNHSFLGVISEYGVIANALKLNNGTYYYTYSDISLIGKYDSYKEYVQDIDNVTISKAYNPNRKEYLHTYK